MENTTVDTPSSKPTHPGQTTTTTHPLGTPVPPPAEIRTVCVYCGSGHGTDPIYKQTAVSLGNALAEAGMNLVYGGGGLGLMGEVARATLAGGGKVTGIIPKFLTEHERMLNEVDDLIVTNDMHERKMLMYDRSDAFIALPGGIGTLEELVEQLTWAQLGQHGKPIIVVNVNGFWDPFMALLAHMREQAFIRAELEVNFTMVTSAEDVVPALLKASKTPTDHTSDKTISEKF